MVTEQPTRAKEMNRQLISIYEPELLLEYKASVYLHGFMDSWFMISSISSI